MSETFLFPLGDNGLISGLVLGFLFGLVLEGAGFASPRKLTGQFTLRDFGVIKVMFTAVVMAGFGLWGAQAAGLMGPSSVFEPTLFFGSIALGGLLIGAGFAIGGYCPGTSLAGLGSGRIDALVFGLGMVIGVWIFAGLFEPLEAFYRSGQGPRGQSLSELFGLPEIVILLALAAAAAGGFWVASKVEPRFGGPVGPEAADSEEEAPEAGARAQHS